MIRAGVVLAGRYQLERRIASGGMGEVWRAFDEVLGRTVAVKRLLAAFPDEPTLIDRFHAEARTMATISHPGVVEVYDFGDDPAAGVYLVMKFIDGESLAQLLARVGRLSAEATMRLVAEAGEALHAAHEMGVTHRDVKPGNLLLRPDGGAMLTDFGIARFAEATGHSTTGSMSGTTGYIAPERANGQPATPRSDIYSLGVVAYRCLAGRVPFAGDSPVEVALRHVYDEPPPLPTDVPPAVRAIVQRAMAKDPAARWPSGAVLAAEARRACTPGKIAVPSQASTIGRSETVPARRRPRRWLVPAAAVGVVALIAATWMVLGQPGEVPQTQDLLENAGTLSPVTATEVASPHTSNPAPSPSAVKPKAGAGTTPPAAPKNLKATPISATTIRLQWTDASVDEEGFTVINAVTSRNVGPNTTVFDWSGLAPSSYMCFKVRAFNSIGVSAYNPAAEADWVCAVSLSGTGPAAPTGLTATPLNPTTIRLQWTDASTDEEGFTITNAVTSRNVGPNTTVYDWSGLAPSSYMCFKVRSYKASGVSDYFPAGEANWVCTTTPAT